MYIYITIYIYDVGLVDNGEDIEAAAVREVLEEYIYIYITIYICI